MHRIRVGETVSRRPDAEVWVAGHERNRGRSENFRRGRETRKIRQGAKREAHKCEMLERFHGDDGRREGCRCKRSAGVEKRKNGEKYPGQKVVRILIANSFGPQSPLVREYLL